MFFHDWECPLRNIVFSSFWQKIGSTDFHATKMNFNVDVVYKLMKHSSIALDKLIIRLNFSKLGMHKDGHLNKHIYLRQPLQNFNPIHLKMLYKVISLTIIIHRVSIHTEYFVLRGHSLRTCVSSSDCIHFRVLSVTKSWVYKCFFIVKKLHF